MKNIKTDERTNEQLQVELETARANNKKCKDLTMGNILLTVICDIEMELESRGIVVVK